MTIFVSVVSFFFQAEDGIRDDLVTGVQTCALPICNLSLRFTLRLFTIPIPVTATMVFVSDAPKYRGKLCRVKTNRLLEHPDRGLASPIDKLAIFWVEFDADSATP